MNNKTAVIIGYDAVSPLGIDLEEQWHMAIKGESEIGPLTRFPLNMYLTFRSLKKCIFLILMNS